MPSIYGIFDKSDVCIYIGSTIDCICSRKKRHRQDYDRCPNRPIYKYMNEKGGFDNFIFKNLYENDNLDKKSLLFKEREFIKDYKPSHNIFSPIQTDEERKAYCKEWKSTKGKLKVACKYCEKMISKHNISRHEKLWCEKKSQSNI